MKSVAVITSTIGRPELERAILSVQRQTYPCKHYIFVDGEAFADKARVIVENYPHLIVTYLPMNTGANGWSNSSINAIAPFLVREDVICYLDDDNWYEPNHLETIVETMEKSNASFVYSLRNFVNKQGEFICRDDFESLGFWLHRLPEKAVTPAAILGDDRVFITDTPREPHIDTNCYGFTRELALRLANSWNSGIHNDRSVIRTLIEWQALGQFTGKYTVNYFIELRNAFNNIYPVLVEMGFSQEVIQDTLTDTLKTFCQMNIAAYGGVENLPWVRP